VSGEAPPQAQPNPFIPPGMSPIVFEGFDTLDTLAARPSIEDKHCSWMDGFMPIGPSTTRTMPGIGPAIFTTPSSPIVWFGFANVADIPYCIAVTANGDIWAINSLTFVSTMIAAATIIPAGIANIGISQWGEQFIIIVASSQTSGNGYWLWDGTTFYAAGAAVPGYMTIPTGIQGSAVETYQGRVWVANGATIEFTAPQDPTDFATSDGGGAFTSFDPYLRIGFQRLIATSGFLYLVADSSINYIGPVVTTAGSPPTTTFSNQNADPEIGTPYANTVQVFSRNIVFANSFGAHQSSGGAVAKISEIVDGTWDSLGVTFFGGFALSSCKAIVYGRRIYATLMPVLNPTNGNATEKKLICWDGKHWWTTPQEIDMTLVSCQEINSQITAYATDGTRIVSLFQNAASVTLKKVIQSKLFPSQGGVMLQKAATRLWGAVIYNSQLAPALTLTIDCENSATPATLTISPQTGNNADVAIFPPQAVAQNGTMLGITLTTMAADMTLLILALGPTVTQYRG
jgi:hypothetical protein